MSSRNRRSRPGMGVNFERNNMIFQMWQKNPNRKLQYIADMFGVTYGTVNRVIHKKLEYGHPIYDALVETNKGLMYAQSVVTRSYIAIRRWYPDCQTISDLMKLSIGSDIDNNPQFTKACEDLIVCTIDRLKSER